MKIDLPSIAAGVIITALAGWLLLGVKGPFESSSDVRWGAVVDEHLSAGHQVPNEGLKALVAVIENNGDAHAQNVNIYFRDEPNGLYVPAELTATSRMDSSYYVVSIPTVPKNYRAIIYANVSSETDLLAVRVDGLPAPREALQYAGLNISTWGEKIRNLAIYLLAGVALGNMLSWLLTRRFARQDNDVLEAKRVMQESVAESRREFDRAIAENEVAVAQLVEATKKLENEVRRKDS